MDLWHLETRRHWAVVTECSEVTIKGLNAIDPDGWSV